MKKTIALATVSAALVAAGLSLGDTAHAESVMCSMTYEALSFELVDVTVDGVPKATLDDYEGLEFFLKRERRQGELGWDLRFIIRGDQQVENVWLLTIDEVSELDEVDELDEVGEEEAQ